MKKASNVFAVIGMILNTVLAIVYSCGGYDGLVIAVEWVVAIIGLIVGISLIASDEKRIGLGIAAIFFVNPLSGIFYLCWGGE